MSDLMPEYGTGYHEEPQKKRRTGRWILGGAAILVLLALVIAGGYLFMLQRAYSSNVTTFSSAPSEGEESVLVPDEERPEDTDAINILLMGMDTDGGSGEDEDLPRVPGGGRSDSLMLVNIPEDRDSIAVMSIPRDLWVEVPGFGQHKVNAGLALGGDQGAWLAANTVENLLDVRIDHIAAVGMQGFGDLVDALGGVTVDSEVAFSSRGYDFSEGPQHLDGDAALVFARERYSFGEGDLQRVRNQQALVKGILQEVATPATLGNPARTHEVISIFSEHLMADEDLTATTAASMAFSSRDAVGDMTFGTLPTGGSGWSGDGQWIWVQDESAIAEVTEALQEGELASYLAE